MNWCIKRRMMETPNQSTAWDESVQQSRSWKPSTEALSYWGRWSRVEALTMSSMFLLKKWRCVSVLRYSAKERPLFFLKWFLDLAMRSTVRRTIVSPVRRKAFRSSRAFSRRCRENTQTELAGKHTLCFKMHVTFSSHNHSDRWGLAGAGLYSSCQITWRGNWWLYKITIVQETC